MAVTRKRGKTAPAKRAKRNPVAAGEPSPFPHLDPAYPVKPWVEPQTATTFATVTVRQDDGRFVSVIAEHPEMRAVAKTQAQAEELAKAAFITHLRQSRANPDSDEGLEVRPEIIELCKRRLRSGKRLTIEQAREKYGRS